MEKKDNLTVGLQVCFYRLSLFLFLFFFNDLDLILLVCSFTTYFFGSNISAPLKTQRGGRQQSSSQPENQSVNMSVSQSLRQLFSCCQLAIHSLNYPISSLIVFFLSVFRWHSAWSANSRGKRACFFKCYHVKNDSWNNYCYSLRRELRPANEEMKIDDLKLEKVRDINRKIIQIQVNQFVASKKPRN